MTKILTSKLSISLSVVLLAFGVLTYAVVSANKKSNKEQPAGVVSTTKEVVSTKSVVHTASTKIEAQPQQNETQVATVQAQAPAAETVTPAVSKPQASAPSEKEAKQVVVVPEKKAEPTATVKVTKIPDQSKPVVAAQPSGSPAAKASPSQAQAPAPAKQEEKVSAVAETPKAKEPAQTAPATSQEKKKAVTFVTKPSDQPKVNAPAVTSSNASSTNASSSNSSSGSTTSTPEEDCAVEDEGC